MMNDCPFCGGPTRPDPDQPNVRICDSAACAQGAAVIYHRVYFEDVYAEPEGARFASVEDAVVEATEHLAGLIGGESAA